MLVTEEQGTRKVPIVKWQLLFLGLLKQNINPTLTQRAFCLLRDHLYINIAFSNVQRSGTTVNDYTRISSSKIATIW